MQKKITLGALFLAIASLLSQFISPAHAYIKGFFGFLNIGYPGMEHMYGKPDFIVLSTFVLLLIATALYGLSKYAEDRLLRLMLAVIFASKVFGILSNISFLFVFYKYQGVAKIFIAIGYYLFHFLVIYLLWRALRFFADTKETAFVENTYGETTVLLNHEASNWQRLANFITDGILCFILFSPLVDYALNFEAVKKLLGAADDTLGPKLSLLLLAALCRFLYYLFFESLFTATPGKYLTATRVVDTEAQKPPFKAILVRTLSRLVPFEPFSFLANGRWHDQWSGTEVAREKPKGVSGSYYLYLLLLVPMLVTGCYFGVEQYIKYERRSHDEAVFFKHRDQMLQRIKHLSVNEVLVLNNEADYNKEVSLLVKQVDDKQVHGVLMDSNTLSEGLRNGFVSEALLQEQVGQFRIISIPVAKLEQLLKTRPGDAGYESLDLFHDGKFYTLEDIQSYFAPRLHFTDDAMDVDPQDPLIRHLFFTNQAVGYPAYLVGIEALKGDFEFAPGTIQPGTEIGTIRSSLVNIKKEDFNADFSLAITIRDKSGKQQVYELISETGSDGYRETKMERTK